MPTKPRPGMKVYGRDGARRQILRKSSGRRGRPSSAIALGPSGRVRSWPRYRRKEYLRRLARTPSVAIWSPTTTPGIASAWNGLIRNGFIAPAMYRTSLRVPIGIDDGFLGEFVANTMVSTGQVRSTSRTKIDRPTMSASSPVSQWATSGSTSKTTTRGLMFRR